MADDKSCEGKSVEDGVKRFYGFEDIYSKEQIEIYDELIKDGMVDVGAIEMLNSFTLSELRAIMRFRSSYGHYFPTVENSKSLGSLHVDVDCSDALKGLKAIQREAKKATAALKELEEQKKRNMSLPADVMTGVMKPSRPPSIDGALKELNKASKPFGKEWGFHHD